MANDVAKITKAPTVKVGGQTAPARQTGSSKYTFKTTWTYPAAMTDRKRNDRALTVDVQWMLFLQHMSNAKDTPRVWRDVAALGTGAVDNNGNVYKTAVKESSSNINSFTDVGKKKYTRASFYPQGKWKLLKIGSRVKAFNGAGAGSDQWTYLELSAPAAPSVSAVSYEPSRVEWSATVTAAADSGKRERYDTRFKVTWFDSFTGKTTVSRDDSFTGETASKALSGGSWQSIDGSRYIKAVWEAWSRGLAGDSSHTVRTHYISRPLVPVISKVTFTSKTANGLATFSVKTSATTEHPVDGIRLQVLRNVEHKTAEELLASAQDSDWEDTACLDNGNCTAMSLRVDELKPDPGLATWVRLKSWHDDEATFNTRSEPMRLAALETPQTAGKAYIISADPEAGGDSVSVDIAWNADDGYPAGTPAGIEVTWSERRDAWTSTARPESFEFMTDGDEAEAEYITGERSARLSIADLGTGTTVYVRVRRFAEPSGGRVYSDGGAYSATAEATTSETPSSVSMTVPAYIRRGDPLPVSWSLAAASEQVAWRLLAGPEGDGAVTVMEGSGTAGSCEVPPDRVEEVLSLIHPGTSSGGMSPMAAAEEDTVGLRVSVTTGGAWVDSEAVEVGVVDAPEVTALACADVAALPAQISVAATASAAPVLSVHIVAAGSAGSGPGGPVAQAAGEVVWSARLSPSWEQDGDAWEASFEVPASVPFRDGASYSVEAAVTDPDTGLASETVSAEFSIAFAHKAPAPSERNLVEASRVEDGESGSVAYRAFIRLYSPDGASDGDVHDLYRLTADGPALIASGLPLDCKVTDPFAPFGLEAALAYRVAVRTQDGSADWADIPYELECGAARFDFSGTYLELPWNLEISDSYEKKFESRTHLDGTAEGYWGAGIGRAGTLSTDVIRFREQAQVDAVRALARHRGPVFVRLLNGAAFEADVQARSIEERSGGGAVACSFDISEVALSEEHTPAEADIASPVRSLSIVLDSVRTSGHGSAASEDLSEDAAVLADAAGAGILDWEGAEPVWLNYRPTTPPFDQPVTLLTLWDAESGDQIYPDEDEEVPEERYISVMLFLREGMPVEAEYYTPGGVGIWGDLFQGSAKPRLELTVPTTADVYPDGEVVS